MRYLAIVHQQDSQTGRIGQRLKERGYEEVLCRPVLGEPLPDSLDQFEAVLVFGGPQSAYDADLGIALEHDLVRQVVAEGVPFLGVCLGAQILARAFGAEVGPHPEGANEIGYYPIEATEGGAHLFPETLNVYHWHKDGFGVPEGAVLLASGPGAFPNQAFQINHKTFGIQFHPEVTGDMIDLWCSEAKDWQGRLGAQPAAVQKEGYALYDKPLGDWLDRFLDHWLEQ